MSTIDDQIKRNRDRYQRQLTDIKQDTDLTADAKARRIEPIYRDAQAVDAQLRAERMEGLREKVRTAEREAFRAPAMRDADPAAAQMNYRHALDAVGEITDARILSSRLERAVATGDKALARATAIRANELQHDGVVRSYLASDSDANRKWSSWAEAHTELERVGQLGETLAFGDAPIQEPDELRALVREAS
jgi:hypothetical protein